MTDQTDAGQSGKIDDLAAFRKLIATPMRSQQREDALAAWSEYKLGRQMDHVRGEIRADGSNLGIWKKGG